MIHLFSLSVELTEQIQKDLYHYQCHYSTLTLINSFTFTRYLLELQEQKDLYQRQIDEIFERCSQIKRSIKKENDLEDLREEMSNRVRQRYDQDDSFWKTQFNARQEGGDKERLMLDDY